MMTRRITALTMQKRNRRRINVFLDGEFAFGLERIVAGWLHIGQELSDERITELTKEDSKEIAFQRALRLLNYRLRTENEIRDRLTRYDTSPDVLEPVIERLKASQLIDDRLFADTWIESRSEHKPRSRYALAYELKQHGVDERVIEASLTDVDDEQLAYQAAGRQARKYKDLEWLEFQNKIYRFLSQRGFRYDLIREVTQRVWKEVGENE